MAEAVNYKQIGSSPIRPDGVDKVTGSRTVWCRFDSTEYDPWSRLAKSSRACSDHAN